MYELYVYFPDNDHGDDIAFDILYVIGERSKTGSGSDGETRDISFGYRSKRGVMNALDRLLTGIIGDIRVEIIRR